MAFCSNCGQQLPDGANACPNCGAFVNPQAAPGQPGYQQAPQQPVAPPQAAAVNGDPDVQQNRGIAWLSYAGLLFLIPLFVKKSSPYCQYHVKQGATLCAVNITYAITASILLVFIGAIFPGGWFYVHSAVYNIFNTLFTAGYIFLFVIAIIGIVNAAKGRKKELPLIGKIPWIAMLLDKLYDVLNK